MTTTEMERTGADDVRWDLDPLVDGDGEAGLGRHLDAADQLAGDVDGYRGRLAELEPAELAQLMEQMGELHEHLGRALSYAGLRYATDTADESRGALQQRAQERFAAVQTRLVWFELEWSALPEERAEALLADPALSFCAHHLRSVRRFREHHLSEPEERILTEKAVTGKSAWARLFTELTSAIEVDVEGDRLPLMSALARLESPNREVRRGAAAAVSEALDQGVRTRAFAFNTLLADKALDDRLRRFPTWLSERNLHNEATDAAVQALVDSVVARYDLPQRWYRLKAGLLGIDRLADYDRVAPIAETEEVIGWDTARGTVLDAYGSFSEELAGVARRFFDGRWIDAPVARGKRGGAFCAYTVPSHHPYVLLNYTGRARDVLTLAHELGHGVHAYLARHQGIFHQTTPLTVAETASVFGEAVTLEAMLATVDDPAVRLALLAKSVDDHVSTVFRQVAMNRFEDAVHRHRRDQGELSVDDINEHWTRTQADMLGDSVEITEGYRSWWSYIPHFIHTPGYVYAYAFGQLLALSVYAQYREHGESFVPRYLEMLSAGGSAPPEELAAIVGCDLSDAGFWARGLDIVDEQLARTEEAARQAGRLPA